MEPTDNQNTDNRWKNNRDLLRILEQERRRRQVAPEEKDPLLEKTPLFARPYKTKKEDELSRRIKNLLGDGDSRVPLSHESPLNPIWIPKVPKSKSPTRSHRPASSKASPDEGIRRESSPGSLGLTPNPGQNCGDSREGHSHQRSEAKAPQSKILPEPVKAIVHVSVQSIEGILKEMTSPLSPLLPPLQSPVRTETSKLPLQAKEKKHIDVLSIEEILREMTSPLLPLLSPLQTPTRAETCKLPPAAKPEASTSIKWHLGNLVTQTKRAVPREGPRETVCGNGREESKKQEHGISSNSCQHQQQFLPAALEAREPPQKSCDQEAKKSHKTCHQVAKDSQKSSGQVAKHFPKSSGEVATEFHNSSVQGAQDAQKTSGPLAKDSQKSCGQVHKAPQQAHLQTKQSCLKPPVHTKEAVPRQPVGVKRPGQTLVHDESKRARRAESEPGPLEGTDQLEVKEGGKPKATEREDLKLALHEPSEKRRDKGSHQANAKGFLGSPLLGEPQECDTLIPSGHRPGDLHKEKVPLSSWEKLFLPARKADLKRKSMRSPEESPAKKKSEDKGDTPRKKKE